MISFKRRRSVYIYIYITENGKFPGRSVRRLYKKSEREKSSLKGVWVMRTTKNAEKEKSVEFINHLMGRIEREKACV